MRQCQHSVKHSFVKLSAVNLAARQSCTDGALQSRRALDACFPLVWAVSPTRCIAAWQSPDVLQTLVSSSAMHDLAQDDEMGLHMEAYNV